VSRIRTTVVALLLASTTTLLPETASAQGRGRKVGHHKASWDAAKYYKKNAGYRGRHLGRNDVIYRGSDDRYYCKRDDGTVGLVLGGIAGGALGNIIAPGGSKTIGTIIGAGAGAIIGKKIDDGEIVCR
jgi:hypothetical protein